MVVPSRSEKSKWRKNKIKDIITKCQKQFPDCPKEKNDINCKNCPFYK